MIVTITWIAGFALLLLWLAVAARRTRERVEDPLPRVAVIMAAIFVAALGFGSAYVWGIGVAGQGMARILASEPDAAPDIEPQAQAQAQTGEPGQPNARTAEPPRARLFLRHVQLLLGPAPDEDQELHHALIGYSPEAALRLPRGYGLAEAKQGWDLLRASAIGPQGLRIEPVEHPEPTGTQVVIHAQRRAMAESPSPDTIMRTANRLTGRGRARCTPAAGAGQPGELGEPVEIDGPGAIYALICVDRVPRAALVFERDLMSSRARAPETPLRVTPLVWRGGSWRPHHVQITSGSLVQIGTMADALPGVTLWEVPAPAGRAELFYPPENLLASCPEWLSGREDQGFFSQPAPGQEPIASELGMAPSLPKSHANDSICVLPFTPPFGLEVRRLLPDLPGIGARSLWAAGLMTTPALLLLLLLCAQARSQLLPRRFYRLLAVGWIAVFLAAVGVWRLLWAHRIDMLRDYESVGTRVLDNQLLLVFGGAALAATCVLLWSGPEKRRGVRGLALALGAWLVWLAVGGYALRGDLAGIAPGLRLAGHALLSLVLGTATGWLPLAGHWLEQAMTRLGQSPRFEPHRRLMALIKEPWHAAMAGLLVLGAVTSMAILMLPRAVALKLGLAWLLVLVVYAALRAAIAGPRAASAAPGALWRMLAAFGLGSLDALLLARFDPGVTVAIAGPGLLLALIFASHDARFADSSLRQIDSYRRHHAPLVLSHAALFGVLGLGIALWALGGLVSASRGEPDAMLSRSLTLGAIHLILFFALAFLPAAALAYLRRGARAAVPWLVAACVLASIWTLRGPLIDRVMSSSTQAANRIAIVIDPGYALLRSETKFLSGITAWRETIVPPAPATTAASPGQTTHSAGAQAGHSRGQLVEGQGYFGAQLIDPGVLLSIENDYFPVLLLREAGIRGLVETSLLLLVLAAGLWIVSGTRFRHGSSAQRGRALAAAVLGVVCIYQPLASLGAVPLTGIALPGFGLDSPSDFWLLFTLVFWVLVWGGKEAGGPSHADREKLEEFDSELRASRLFRRVRAAVSITAAIFVMASLLLLCRAAAFALRRPNPVDPQGRAVEPFEGLEHAIDYAFTLQCPWPRKSIPAASQPPADQAATDTAPEEIVQTVQTVEAAQESAAALVPDDLLGDPEHEGIQRFHAALRASWQVNRARATRELARFLAQGTGCGSAGPDRSGPWTFERSADNPSECRMTFKMGWPEVEIVVERNVPTRAAMENEDSDDATSDAGQVSGPALVHTASCSVDVRADVLRLLRFPARRPYRDARIRLVSRAMGAAARDRGELVSGHLIVRLRPGAGPVDVSRGHAGMHVADEVRISSQLTVTVRDDIAILRRASAPSTADSEAWLFMRNPPDSGSSSAPGRVQVLEADEGTWRLLPSDVTEIPLSRLALLVVGGPDARSLWLFRPPTEWPGETAAVHPLLADDITTVVGERRRHYLFGGLIPEIGWVNPYHTRMSLGLDGWVRVAMGEYEQRLAPADAAPEVPTWLDSGEEVPYCGTLAPRVDPPGPPGSPETQSGQKTGPLTSTSTGASTSASGDPALLRVCHRSPLDGVLECRVAIQPELAIELHHLLELVSLSPQRLSGDRGAVHPVLGGYVLMRGDTGEIVAQGEFVPGRASSVYAPATPEIEQHLIRLREDRDPKTGRKMTARGQSSAEKIDWSQPLAVGSTMKPLLGRALELADELFARSLSLDGAKMAGAQCRTGNVHALFGHCPPTDSLWNHTGATDMSRFLAESINWYQAAIGLLGTAVPHGTWGFGKDEQAVELPAILARNAGDYRTDSALWTRHRGKLVISADHTVHLDALRKTDMWQRFEEILGRPLCTAGSKTRCRSQGARRDLCAARALPIQKPTRDLRYLVALGPSNFDFYPELADKRKRMSPQVSTREYLQFLRGSGLHPLGSLAQLTDAFGRVIYEYDLDPARAGYALAASWFPVPAAGRLPAWDCSRGVAGRDVQGGLCAVLASGTGRASLGSLLADPRFVIYGAKTGTIDSLADIAEQREACERFAMGHTIPDRPAKKDAQPYWLTCSKERASADINDSLLVIGFGVRAADDVVPLTLGLRFQRSGPGFASRVARHFMDVTYDYFAAKERAP